MSIRQVARANARAEKNRRSLVCDIGRPAAGFCYFLFLLLPETDRGDTVDVVDISIGGKHVALEVKKKQQAAQRKSSEAC